MAPIDLRLRNLENGELLLASFDNEVDAGLWLHDRPPMMEVLGVIAQSDDAAIHAALRRAVRDLDDAERAVVERLDAEAERAYAERKADEERRADEERAAYLETMRTADPARPMQVAWSLAGGFAPVDPMDPRDITDDVRAAVLAWVRERDGWVADRGLVVGEATVTVWPLAVPDGESRVHRGGQFVPVSGPTA